MKPKFSIRTVLILVALFGGFFAFIRWNDPVSGYRRNHDAASLRVILSRRIKHGDELAKIQNLLGPAKRYGPPGFKRAMVQVSQRKPRTFPEGVDETDDFYAFAEGPDKSTLLQFRNGRLVNFDPKEFQGPGLDSFISD